MNFTITNTINLTLDAYCVVICFFIIVSILTSPFKNAKSKIWFVITCISDIFLCISDGLCWIMDGSENSLLCSISKTFQFIYFFSGIIVFYAYIRYVMEYLSISIKKNVYYDVCLLCTFLYLVLLIITPFTGAIYTFTDNKYYHRGNLYFITLILQGILYLDCLILILKNNHLFKSNLKLSFLSFILLPLIMQAIQVKYFGLSLVTSGCTISFFIVYINLNSQLEKTYIQKNSEIQQREEFLQDLQNNTIIGLSNLVENRDIETGQHVRRTSTIVKLLAEQTRKDGFYTDILTDDYIKLLIKAAPMHDIGKIVVPDEVLKKPGKLTPEEFEIMKTHAKEGERIVYDIIGKGTDKKYIKIARETACYHHEKWNGTGYPSKLIEFNIPLCARLMAIADVFDALVSPRCYKLPMDFNQAVEIIKQGSGTHFDPVLVKEFLLIKDQLTDLQNKY